MDPIDLTHRIDELRQAAFPVKVLAVTGGAVSYTHLDVYKRQQIGRVIDPAYLPQDFLQISFRGLVFCHALCYTCLLYTSRCV